VTRSWREAKRAMLEPDPRRNGGWSCSAGTANQDGRPPRIRHMDCARQANVLGASIDVAPACSYDQRRSARIYGISQSVVRPSEYTGAVPPRCDGGMTMRQLLRRLRACWRTTRSTLKAVRWAGGRSPVIRDKQPKVVLLDVQMPLVSGIELFYMLRGDPATAAHSGDLLHRQCSQVRDEIPTMRRWARPSCPSRSMCSVSSIW
jgi:hypothetical protein